MAILPGINHLAVAYKSNVNVNHLDKAQLHTSSITKTLDRFNMARAIQSSCFSLHEQSDS